MLVKTTAAELRKALAEIEIAESNGFEFCEAVFKAESLDGVFVKVSYSDLFEKAHPSDPRFNWGRMQNVTKRKKFIDGKLVRIES